MAQKLSRHYIKHIRIFDSLVKKSTEILIV